MTCFQCYFEKKKLFKTVVDDGKSKKKAEVGCTITIYYLKNIFNSVHSLIFAVNVGYHRMKEGSWGQFKIHLPVSSSSVRWSHPYRRENQADAGDVR